ncbi:uncharacterized protein [Asterias amurensis]|uniref:uncharacterized protein isoform X2 n=1 Tax=Asterias amurensis TaxID=7602 RepID=UPI003AB27675
MDANCGSSFQVLLIVVVVSCQVIDSLVIKNCPGNVYSKDGYAEWTMPAAHDDAGLALIVECNHPSLKTLYKEYQTEVACIAEDSAGDTATCTFSVFVADGVDCVGRNGSPRCVCLEYRDFFDPCYCQDGFSGLNCQYEDAVQCGVADDSASCQCSGSSCDCLSGFKGEFCQLDFQKPGITCPEDVYTNEESSVVTWHNNATDNDGSPVIQCDPPSGSLFERNSAQNTTIIDVACSARDAAGNQGECSFKVTIDLEPPLIPGCPGNIYTTNATLDWPLDLGVDNSHPSLDVTCDPGPGFTFTDPVTDVVCSTKDAAGNMAERNCTFQVFLADGISCSSSISECSCDDLNANCTCMVGYSGLDCSAKDASSCVSSGNPGPGCMCDGASCNCTDGFKGTSCQLDFQAPVLHNCPFGIVYSLDPVVTYRPMWTDDNKDSSPEMSCYPEEGSEFLNRRTDVTCTAQDLAGNKVSSCGFPVYRMSGSDCPGDGDNCLCSGLKRCTCVYGYLGPLCQDCRSCQNGGSNQNERCECECPALHDGVVCSDCYEATADHCLNGGTFVADTCSCACQDGWTGKHCTLKHGANCAISSAGCLCDGDGCSCNSVYEGPMCEMCKPCQHDGWDQNMETCECHCPGFYQPPLCQECDSNSTMCLNDEVFDPNSCSCICKDGWTGANCSQPVSSFASQCPTDIIKSLEGGSEVVSVSWLNPVINDGPGIPAAVICTPSSGSEFQEGTTEVMCTATDASSGLTASCTFNVLVDDTEPVLSCPSPISVNHQRFFQTSKVAWKTIPATDAISGSVSVSCIPPSGSAFDLGETTVVCSAFDDAMNMGWCQFTVEVNLRDSPEFPKSCWKCSADENEAGQCRYNDDEDDYVCFCPAGYTSVNGSCEDIDECADMQRCDDRATCTNYDGSYQCTCHEGLFWDTVTCREYPHTMHPDIPNPTGNLPPLEKKFAIDIAIAEESLYGCDWSVNQMTASCQMLLNTFKMNILKNYESFSSSLSRIDADQSDMGGGSIPHTVVYDYNKMSESERALSAQEFYEQTLAADVSAGRLGALRLVSDCERCSPPKDLTNLCGSSPPTCGDGYSLQEVRPDDGTCYYTCESLCVTGYCNLGSCIHNPPYPPRCRCPSDTSGPQCEPILVTDSGGGKDKTESTLNIALIVGCSVGGGFLLIVFLGVTSHCLKRKKSEGVVTRHQQNHINAEFKMEEQ